LLRLSANRASR